MSLSWARVARVVALCGGQPIAGTSIEPASATSMASRGTGSAATVPGTIARVERSRPSPWTPAVASTWFKKSHFAGGERQLQALLRSVPADDHVLVAKKCSGHHGGARLRLRQTHGRPERGRWRCQTHNQVINTTINQVMLTKMARNWRIEVDSTSKWANWRGGNRYETQREGGRTSNNYKKEEAEKYNTTIN